MPISRWKEISMVTEVSKMEVSAAALQEIQLVQISKKIEAKRIEGKEAALEAETRQLEERKEAREIETESAVQPVQPEDDHDYGKYNDYTVNSDHEMVVTVRERVTGKEIKQIPSDEALAARQAIREATDHIIDETV